MVNWRAGKDKTGHSFVIEIVGDLEEHLLRWNAFKRGRITSTPPRSQASGRFKCLATDVEEMEVCALTGLRDSSIKAPSVEPSDLDPVSREPIWSDARLQRARPALVPKNAASSRSQSAPRVRANELVWIHAEQPKYYPKPLKTEQIIKILMDEFSITRNSALSAANKAIQKLDPDNSLRRSRTAPIARMLSAEILEKISSMAGEGLSGSQIARQLNLQQRTVNQNLRKMRRTTKAVV